ncbi:MAG: GIY-YIG nuclease family protein [Candidatus Gottesmanbacteria bacterium]
MFTVYILQNNISKRYYIGSTNDIKRRVEEHNRGQTMSTRRKGVWTIIYSEEVNTKLEAVRREKQIKSYKGGNGFKELIER